MKKENNKITFETMKNALATLDTRFTVYDDVTDENKFHKNDTSALQYCSIHAVQLDNSINKNIVFALYYVDRTTVRIKCAYRFKDVCSACESYTLTKNKQQFERTVNIEELAECVHALLTDECERLKMSKYTQNVQKTTARKASTTKKKNA